MQAAPSVDANASWAHVGDRSHAVPPRPSSPSSKDVQASCPLDEAWVEPLDEEYTSVSPEDMHAPTARPVQAVQAHKRMKVAARPISLANAKVMNPAVASLANSVARPSAFGAFVPDAHELE